MGNYDIGPNKPFKIIPCFFFLKTPKQGFISHKTNSQTKPLKELAAHLNPIIFGRLIFAVARRISY